MTRTIERGDRVTLRDPIRREVHSGRSATVTLVSRDNVGNVEVFVRWDGDSRVTVYSRYEVIKIDELEELT